MNFFNRLKYYLFGVALGILIVMGIFKDRKLTSWTPENQVLKEIKTYRLIVQGHVADQMGCLGIDSTLMKAVLGKSDVSFEKSRVRETVARVYYLEPEHEKIAGATVELKDSTVLLLRLEVTGNECR